MLFAQGLRAQHPILAEIRRDLMAMGGVTILTLLTVITVI
jgi:hypothetical protein